MLNTCTFFLLLPLVIARSFFVSLPVIIMGSLFLSLFVCAVKVDDFLLTYIV
jgi:hypothetical protein